MKFCSIQALMTCWNFFYLFATLSLYNVNADGKSNNNNNNNGSTSCTGSSDKDAVCVIHNYEDDTSSYGLDRHFGMLNDQLRNQVFASAMEKAVYDFVQKKNGGKENNNNKSERPPQIVDIGAGSGLQSMIACRALRKYYDDEILEQYLPVVGIEKNPHTFRLAERILSLNGMENCVQLLNEISKDVVVDEEYCFTTMGGNTTTTTTTTTITKKNRNNAKTNHTGVSCISKPADILVSETQGYYMLLEGWASTWQDAKMRGLMTPETIVIPASANVYGQLVWGDHCLQAGNLVEGFDLSPFMESFDEWGYHNSIDNFYPARAKNLSDPFPMLSYDFHPTADPIRSTVYSMEVPTTDAGRVCGLVVWWEATLYDDVKVNTGPGRGSHWAQTLFTGPPLDVVKGDLVTVKLADDTRSWYGNFGTKSTKESLLAISNQASFPIDVYWIDQRNGKDEIYRSSVYPEEDGHQNTVVGHQFLLVNEEYGLEYTVTIAPLLTVVRIQSATDIMELK